MRLAANPPGDHVAGLDEGAVVAAAIGHQRMPELDELVDVELVVGEENEVLEVLGGGAGVMAQPVQRIVHPRRGEQRQRLGLARAQRVGAVGNAVVHGGQVRQVEQVAHQQSALGAHAAFDVVVLGKREVHGDRLRAGPDLERYAVVLQQ